MRRSWVQVPVAALSPALTGGALLSSVVVVKLLSAAKVVETLFNEWKDYI